MMGLQHYILEGGSPRPVSETLWDNWTKENTKRLKVRETHIVKKSTLDVCGKVLTYFTGIDNCPGADKPYLWQTKLFDATPFETWRHTSEEDARRQHDLYVRFIVSVLRKEGIELGIIEIKGLE